MALYDCFLCSWFVLRVNSVGVLLCCLFFICVVIVSTCWFGVWCLWLLDLCGCYASLIAFRVVIGWLVVCVL